MTQHTPGPWKVSDTRFDGIQCIIEGGKGYIANTLHGNDEANAQLIAASPDLLNSLSKLAAAAEMCPGRSCGEEEWYRWINLIQAALRASHEAMAAAGVK